MWISYSRKTSGKKKTTPNQENQNKTRKDAATESNIKAFAWPRSMLNIRISFDVCMEVYSVPENLFKVNIKLGTISRFLHTQENVYTPLSAFGRGSPREL